MSKEIWDKLKSPPENALKRIAGGRLSGKTDINPQWRYEAMTEVFGQCGIGWKYEIDKLWTEAGPAEQVFCFAQVNLYTAKENGWSDPIPGVGGSMLVEQEKVGLHANDEAFKMAITDALSVALKMLGMAADIYRGFWDGSKYNRPAESNLSVEAEKKSPKTSYEQLGELLVAGGYPRPYIDLLCALANPKKDVEAICKGDKFKAAVSAFIVEHKNIATILLDQLAKMEEGVREAVMNRFEEEGIILQGDERNYDTKIMSIVKIWREFVA